MDYMISNTLKKILVLFSVCWVILVFFSTIIHRTLTDMDYMISDTLKEIVVLFSVCWVILVFLHYNPSNSD